MASCISRTVATEARHARRDCQGASWQRWGLHEALRAEQGSVHGSRQDQAQILRLPCNKPRDRQAFTGVTCSPQH